MTLVTLTGNVSDLADTTFDARRTKVWLEASTPFVVDETDNKVRLGPASATVNDDGSFTFTDLLATNSTGINPPSFQYRLWVDYAKAGGDRSRVRQDFGWFSLTATTDLSDVVAEQYVPPTWISDATTLLEGYVADAEAARDAAVDISNIDDTDSAVAALANPANGPLTVAAFAGLFARGRNLEDYPGVDPTGVAECATAIQAAIDAADAAGVPLVSKGGHYKIATGLTILNHCDLSRAVFDYTATSGTAITVGETATIVRKTIRLPYVAASAKTTTGWAQVAGTVGVKIINATECQIHTRDIRNFETGVFLYGDSAGLAWNAIHLGAIINNKVNLKFDSTATGYTNQNTFYGGRFNHESTEGSLVSGTRHILMANSTFVPDGNMFLGTSLESTGVVEEIVESYGTYNAWRDCRWESASAPGTKKIHWRGTAKGNIIDAGYEAEKLTVVADAGTQSNQLRSPLVDQTIWISASSMVLASGGPALAQVGGVPYWTLRDGFTDEVAAEIVIPSGWSKVDVTLVWFSQNGAAGNVGLQGKTQSHSVGATAGFGSFAGAGATVAAGAAFVVKHTLIGDDVSVTPGPAHFSALRDGTAGTDTSAGNAGLLGIRLDRAA